MQISGKKSSQMQKFSYPAMGYILKTQTTATNQTRLRHIIIKMQRNKGKEKNLERSYSNNDTPHMGKHVISEKSESP